MEGEIWNPVTDWEIYDVSNMGKIRNSITGKIKLQQKITVVTKWFNLKIPCENQQNWFTELLH